ncbi:TetR/AcrR family transcriptional regulator [Streptomyces guryensis]|uniref:TetR/AcrR family transcriptional regulator n=1 Tax=Streptomyces guryensis TaxID=2886947 RepID=A0A9Q3Z872_9ACTN|nr:TetR/AcrR family transcriptional regulator [Streptomyces guryensis]MCD9878203.1 TetR/AcrR family transcriptional regulator [Streptomyces guryensis]
MAVQARAERTREALIRAAADVVDDKGYNGATLVAISRSARVSMGALTFHFASKSELAEAVVERAATVAGKQTASAAGQTSPLRAVGALLQALARLLDEDVVVRAASLLARERPDIVPAWHSSWMPMLSQLLDEAEAAGELRHGVRPSAVAGLVMYLLTAVEVHPRTAPGQERFRGAAGAMSRLWPFVCHGIAATAP